MGIQIDCNGATDGVALDSNGGGETGFEPIAIVGFALKFPQDVTSEQAFWNLLVEKRSTRTDVPKDRWNVDGFYKPNGNKTGHTKVRGGHFIADDIGCFDAPFFSITPAEAECLDPQQRILLETSYHALENSGIEMDKAAGTNTSVHVGCFFQDYNTLVKRDEELPGKYRITGAGCLTILANRLSWFYDFKGPSIAVDTACSSSLVALHLACQELQSGQSSMGLVAGCNLLLDPFLWTQLSDMNFLSADGVSYSFDQRANGYSRGEGFAVVVLKKLSQAIQDGDNVRGVIRSTGCNQDGRTPGISQPSAEAQIRLIQETYRRAGLDMSQTRYFEAHGTGTAVGDPLEASAISKAFQGVRTKENPIYVGAVKSNMGHLEGASGLAGIIKTVLALEQGVIPPNVYPEQPNPKITADNITFPRSALAWPGSGLRRASVNSFGFGGTNAHVVIDDADHYLKARRLTSTNKVDSAAPQLLVNGWHEPTIDNRRDSITNAVSGASVCSACTDDSIKTLLDDQIVDANQPRARLLTLSTFDESGISRVTSSYDGWLQQLTRENSVHLDDLAYTLCEKRSKMPWRSFAVISQDKLSSPQWSSPIRAQKDVKVCFLFTGQGAQWHQMGYELLQYPAFRESMEDADRYFKSLGSRWSVLDELYVKSNDSSKLNDPECSQPICTALQVAIVDLLRTWNTHPSVVIGHSSGEIAAAYCAGKISRESAWMIAYYRGLAVAAVRDLSAFDGGMVSVQLDPDTLSQFLDPHNALYPKDTLAIACFNSPSNVTVSGSKTAIDRLTNALKEHGFSFRILNVNVAYHSSYMKPVGMIYERLLRNISAGHKDTDPVQFVSTVTGELLDSSSWLTTSEYWVENLVSAVRFSDAMSKISTTSGVSFPKNKNGSVATADMIIEIGPHPALKSPLREIFKSQNRTLSTEYCSVLVRNSAANITALECVGRLHCVGYPVDFAAVNETRLSRPKLLTTLPLYAFNHQTRYWLEGRVSREHRFRRHPHHELLGTRIDDWNELEAQWNNRILLSEKPFLRDHRVNGLILYPAAGMIVMAIEAIRQLLPDSQDVRGYQLRDVTFSKSITLTEDTQGTETQFFLRPAEDKQIKKGGNWNEFRLCVYEGEQWSECCRGAISMDYAEKTPSFGTDEHQAYMQHKMQELKTGVGDCRFEVSTEDAYAIFKRTGIEYGPAFRGMDTIKWDKNNQATAMLNQHHWKNHVEDLYHEQHLLHPSTLDAMFQLMFPAISNGDRKPLTTGVPTRLPSAWISADLLSASNVQQLVAYAGSRLESFRTYSASFIAAPRDMETPCIIGEIEFSSIGNVDSTTSDIGQGSDNRLFRMAWKPDVDFVRGEMLPSDSKAIAVRERLPQDKESLCLAGMMATLEQMPASLSHLPSHMQKYVQWMKSKVSAHQTCQQSLEDICSRLENYDVESQVLARVARNLPAILSGEVDPLSLLFSDNILSEYYVEICEILFQQTTEYVDLLVHKNSQMRILEVGAGTGSATASIMDVVQHRLAEYVYTDISPSFFGKAKDRFPSSKMVFKTLDVSRDPLEQDFEADSFDLIIAANVLHATNDIRVSLSNCRKLLKTGGRMILFENTNPQMLRSAFIFGLLPGWWSSSHVVRNQSPLLTDRDWHSESLRSGFSGIDVQIKQIGTSPEDAMAQAMITRKFVNDGASTSQRKISIVLDESSPTQRAICEKYQACTATTKYLVHRVGWQDAMQSDITDSICLFLPGMDNSLLETLDKDGIARINRITFKAKSLVWVSYHGQNLEHNPREGLVRGLARTIRSENDEFRFITLTLENAENVDNTIKHISTILNIESSADPSDETEYEERQGVLCINRLCEHDHLSKRIFPDFQNVSTIPQLWKTAGNVHLSIANVGLLDTLYFREDTPNTTPLGPDEIEIRAKATGLNFRDLLIALGQVNSTNIGIECSGVITRVGPSLKNDLRVGDRVIAVAEGAMCKFCRCNSFQAKKIPENMDLVDAVSYAVVFCTAYYSLVHWARVKKGESVLIHSGAGGFGQAAIQLTKFYGCEIFTTVGSAEKAEFLTKTYGIPASHIFSSRNLGFAKGIKRMTGGRGVDVVLNSLAGEALRQSWQCVAQFGRFIEVGKKDIFAPQVSSMGGLPMLPFSKNVMFASVDLVQISATKEISHILDEVMILAEQNVITTPRPLHVFQGSEIEKAYRFMQTGKHMGKIVIQFNEDDVVQVQPAQVEATFNSNASYVVAGAFGGIGQSIAKWMVERGARNLILPSRSPVGGSSTRETFVRDLREKGVTVATPMCNIGDTKQLQDALREYQQAGMPHVRGCIQSAMVLKDSTFEKMSPSDWKTALDAKLNGSWNLHELLPRGLDFFVMLSSQSGLSGSFGQSNYAAGNTYQDELAAHRVQYGEKAVSIDLGSVKSVGYLAENPQIDAMVRFRGQTADVEVESVFKILNFYCNPNYVFQSAQDAQVSTALPIPSELKARGVVGPRCLSRPLFSPLHAIDCDHKEDVRENKGVKQPKVRIMESGSMEEVNVVIEEAIQTQLSNLLAIEKDNIDTSRPIHAYGVDSLVAVEMRNWFLKGLGADVPLFEILGNDAISVLTQKVAAKSSFVPEGLKSS